MKLVDPTLHAALDSVAHGNLVFLTGAGISAESGIPTFRGKAGFWTVGAKEYHPQELATYAMFSQQPDAVWPWYLYRRATCRAARENDGHLALATLERAIGHRFCLVTQNVDGLHLRAGNSRQRTYEIHGNIDFMRCAAECTATLLAVPDLINVPERNAVFDPAWRTHLTCPTCGAWTRPHVLWFDETYDEARYRYESSMRAVVEADLLVTIGTSGATTLPRLMARIAADRDIAVIDINPEPNPFSMLAGQLPNGISIQSNAGAALPAIVDRLTGTA